LLSAINSITFGNNIADDLANKFFCVKTRRGVKITGRLRKPEGLIRIQTGVECVAERSTALGDEGDAFVEKRRKNPC